MLKIIAFFTYLSLTLSLLAKEETNNNCFYAISSIRFHLDTLTDYFDHTAVDEKVIFTSDEIENLWIQAEKSHLTAVSLAKDYYYRGMNEKDNGQFNRHIYKSQEILENVWVELNNNYYVEDAFSEIELSSTFNNFDPFLKKQISNDLFKEIKPYLLPSSHTIKSALDHIFYSKHSILRDMDHFTHAGFSILYKQPLSHIVVAKHSALQGYLVKAYLDSDKKTKNTDPGWKWLVRRCQGAENIRKLIRNKNLQFFTVPDKWIYMTDPRHYRPTRQNIILVVTDMRLVSKEESREAWLSLVTKQHLEELYCIFSHGYSSSWLIENIPFTKEGTFSCIDTEYPKRTVDYGRARKYFNEEMQNYWDLLIKTGGNPTNSF